MTNTKQLKQEFDEIFDFDNVFGTDNFEDPKYINHPCYAHAGVIEAMWRWFETKLKRINKQREVELRNLWKMSTLVYPDTKKNWMNQIRSINQQVAKFLYTPTK